MTPLSDTGFLDVSGQTLEYRMIGPRPHDAPTLVLLHDGLGCAATWESFADRLAADTGAGVFAYSRAGYGRSSKAVLPRPVSYMREEALTVLPKVLDAVGFRRGLLIGHGDGASIATIYAGNVEDHRVRGLVAISPHFFIEDAGVAAVKAAREAYDAGDLRGQLARYHADVDNAFRGWSDVWLDPAFRSWDVTEELAYIRVPVLVMQGEADPSGTARQIEVAREECYCPVEVAVLPGVKDRPHREAPDKTLAAVAAFVNRLLRDHHEGDLAAHAA